MRQMVGMKPQDIVVLLKVLMWREKQWRQIDLAQELGLSQTEINFSLNRLVKSGLLAEDKREPYKLALTEFLIHGLRYVYPAELGPAGRGIATAQSHESLAKKLIVSDEQKVVWADPEGDIRGQTIEPLYTSVPFAAKKDPGLHEWLALIDAIRIGSARVRNLAVEKIQKKLGTAA